MAEPESGLSCRSGPGCPALRVLLATPLQREKKLNSSLPVRRPSCVLCYASCLLTQFHPHGSSLFPQDAKRLSVRALCICCFLYLECSFRNLLTAAALTSLRAMA